MLIKFETIAEAAEARGFKIKNIRYENGGSSLAINEPTHDDKGYRSWTGDVYGTDQFLISDRPSGLYGYNPFFYGPWHDGYAQSNNYGLEKLCEHTAMTDVFN